jgi:hypothetical protein
MIQLFKAKGLVSGLLLLVCALNVNAQKINEQELKTGVTTISNPLEYLETLKPVTFRYDSTKFQGQLAKGVKHGFLIQDFKSKHPELVFEAFKTFQAGKGNVKTIRYDEVSSESLIPVLVAAIKEQQLQIEALKRELQNIQAK